MASVFAVSVYKSLWPGSFDLFLVGVVIILIQLLPSVLLHDKGYVTPKLFLLMPGECVFVVIY